MDADHAPEEPSLVRVLDALGARRHAAIGLVIGTILAALAFVYRVVLVDPAAGAVTSPILFAALGFVLAVAVAALVTIVLTAVAAVRTARRME